VHRFYHNYAGQPFLMLFYDGITQEEIDAIRTGKVRLALIPVGEHTIILAYSIEGFTVGWSEAIFAMGRVHPDNRPYEHVPDGEGWLLSILLVERSTGIIKSMRAGTMTPLMTKRLQAALDRLTENVGSFTDEKHMAEIRTMYARYPDIGKMVRQESTVMETMGRPFPKKDI